jgi:hypothetical protein
VPPPEVAVSVAVVAVTTEDTVAVKVARVDPSVTVTEDGTVTAVALLVRLTAWPPVPACAFRDTVHVSVPAPVIEPFAQLRLVTAGWPVPLKLIVLLEPSSELLLPVDELLDSVTVPLTTPAAVGAKPTVKVAV